ncbi:sulfatase-like hydrolase/transferase [Marinifilum sp.]|uniref:sulfatase-like hydrolase/transferase n=1 Tax=Marinifilum sp. TaxID=2033137 RepID=UPI003BAC33DD
MKKRFVYLFYIISIFSLGACSETKKEKKPNILIILADDAGYADFGFMGSQDLKTPNIDKIAKEGVHFTDFHVTGSVCSPSRAGLLTGRFQQRFGHEQNLGSSLGMDTSEVTIADMLKTEGYKTAIFGKWHLGDDAEYHPNRRGFDEFWGMLAGHRSYFYNEKKDKPGNSKSIQHNGEFVPFKGYLTDVLGDKAIEFIKNNKDNKWFTYLSYTAVHTPMEATKEDMALFEGHPRQKLAAMTWAMDRSIGKVIKTLEETGQLDNTIIYFFSDNGGPSRSNQSSNLPLKGIKGMEFEGGHRVASAIMWKGHVKAGTQFNKLTSSLDVYKTTMAAVGVQKDPGKALDGVNLFPYLNGEISGAPHDELHWRISPWAASRMGQYKLIRAKGLGYRLYDLSNDIGEYNDISKKEPELLNKAIQKLETWEEGTIDQLWDGYPGWIEVKKFMYSDLMNNRDIRFYSPGQLKSHKKKTGKDPELLNEY